MKDIIPQLIITIVPMFFSGFSAYLFARLKEKDAVEKEATEELRALKNGVMILLRESLKNNHDLYMEKGQISSDELRQYKEIDSAYVKAGGNHVNADWLDDMENLKLKG